MALHSRFSLMSHVSRLVQWRVWVTSVCSRTLKVYSVQWYSLKTVDSTCKLCGWSQIWACLTCLSTILIIHLSSLSIRPPVDMATRRKNGLVRWRPLGLGRGTYLQYSPPNRVEGLDTKGVMFETLVGFGESGVGEVWLSV
jgi:hypothetical protein